jgi:hypothetical protein
LYVLFGESGFIPNLGQRTPGVMKNGVDQLAKSRKSMVARNDLLDLIDPSFEILTCFIDKIDELGVLWMS